ncbi:hypothetical protein BN7_5677 [Wickerhamomyces ciferrii]|uniref:Alcohol acetyltransferase n=1 Tax=Wickerhamomyces ciferrii (strain ATCC 14091 / BCRC 22168 / CBS 111 / JCM 3599 / NBRC 0793 / NRRL Y-1031 F-60-10) TaxID=1206466 RepID=K0KX78_WICCF|nr:uncharacterized protein BN7_5677 [Wickerhamomyces ciferrii]CCH46089.1 hypothetical protein BN7_5677 [Wickerhamomyces ciferrii]
MASRVEQELTPHELYQCYKNINKVTSCFLVGLKLSQKLDPEIFEDAIKELFLSRRRLKFSIYMEDENKPILIELSNFPSNCIEFWSTDDDQETLLNKFHNIYFEFGKRHELSYKFIIVNNEWIYFICEHTLFDGSSAALILEDILKILNTEELPPDPNQYDELELNQISKPSYGLLATKTMESCAPNWINEKFRYLFNPLLSNESLKPGWIINTPKKHTYQYPIHIISFDRYDFQTLKELGKKHGVKFTSFWSYLNLLSFSKMEDENITLMIPYNVRPLLSDIYERAYGLIVSSIQHIFKPPNPSTANIEWEYCKNLEKTLSEKNLIYSAGQVGLLDYYDPLDLVKRNINKPRSATLEISNLGLRKWVGMDDLHAKEYIFSQANSLTGALITQSIASTNEKVNIVIGCAPEFEVYFTEYIDNLEYLVKDVLNGNLE